MSDDPCCGRPLTRKESTLREAGFDPLDVDILTIARFYWQQFALPESQAWLYALRKAETTFPDRDAAAIALELLATVQAKRLARVSAFHFSNPGCRVCRHVLSEHERQFMGVYQALRDGRMGVARTHAMLLCEGNDTDDFIAQMQSLLTLIYAEIGVPSLADGKDRNSVAAPSHRPTSRASVSPTRG